MMADSRHHVLVLVPPRPDQFERLERGYAVHRLDGGDPDALLRDAGPLVEAVVTDGGRGLGADLVERLPRLGLVASLSAGMEGIDRAALKARRIPLVNSSPALAGEVADHAMLLLLAAWKGLLAMDAHVRSGAWASRGELALGRSLAGRRLGLLGIGTIGEAIGERARAFGLGIAYHARRRRPVPWRHEPELMALAEASDILVVAVPGGEETRGLVSREVIEALGPEGVLVNIARGSVVDEEALIGALAEGRLGAAGLDVFAAEPDVDPRLRALPNVVLAPHAGSATEETREAMSRLVVDNLDAHFAGRPLLSEVG
jgi:lactate dehydrogenase-like 2-hydroxyacid dehydrogenase